MLKIWQILLLFLVANFSVALAQDNGDIEAESKKEKGKKAKDEDVVEDQRAVTQDIKTKWGIFANATSGVTLGTFGKLEKDIQKTETLGESYGPHMLGSQYGGNLFVQIGNRFLVGGGWQGFNYTANGDDRDSIGLASLNANFFSGNVGFIVFQKYRVVQYRYGDSIYTDKSDGGEKLKTLYRPDFKYHWCIFPYAGFGVGTSRLKVSNYSPEKLSFGDQLIDRSSVSTFKANLNVVELGVGVRFRKGKKGGLMLGAELGGYFNVGGSKWKNEAGAEVKNVNDAALAGGYLRLTVGGGFFKIDDPQAELEKAEKAKRKSEDAFVNPDEVKEDKPKKEKKAKKAKAAEEAPAETKPAE